MALFEQGYSFVAGLDEAGRGCLAGPVVAAAVILPLDDNDLLTRFAGVRDSKQITAAVRECQFEVIMQHAVAVSVGTGSCYNFTSNTLSTGLINTKATVHLLTWLPCANMAPHRYTAKALPPYANYYLACSQHLNI